MTARRPPLFDVLAPPASSPASSTGEPGDGSGLAEPASGGFSLRESVRRELALLFNCTALSAARPLEQLSHVRRSTLEYGLPDLAGKAASSLDHRWLEAQLAQAIRLFEPRLEAESVRVRARPQRAVSHNVLSFEIDAALQPSLGAESIELASELDLESGVARVLARPRERGLQPRARA